MSGLWRWVVVFTLCLGGLTLLHGTVNLGWLEQTRPRLAVGHLPVT